MAIKGTVWEVLKAARPGAEGAVLEALRPYRPALIDYARGKGVPPPDIETVVRQSLKAFSDPSFVGPIDPRDVRFRPLLFALIEAATRKPRSWNSMSEKTEDLGPPVLDVTNRANDDFDRLWQLHLLRGAVLELSREAPRLALVLTLRHQDARSPAEITAQIGRDAEREIEAAETRLKLLLARALHAYTATAGQFAAEVEAMARAPGPGGLHDLARRLFSSLSVSVPEELAPRARSKSVIAGFAGVVTLAAVVVGWTAYELRSERRARAQEREEARLAAGAEAAVERASIYLYTGGEAASREQDLERAVSILQRLRPGSPALARAGALRIGSTADPALYKEAAQRAAGSPWGAALAWDYWMYQAIREATWGEPGGKEAPPEASDRRVEADRALLGGQDERALDLYMEFQLIRPGDPVVWLGGALAALRAGSPSAGARFARNAAEILDPGGPPPREGCAVARALEGLCYDRLGREAERLEAFREAARRAPGNAHARNLASKPGAGPALPVPELPRRAAGVMAFEAAGESSPQAIETALDLIRRRLLAVGLLPGGEVAWDPDLRRLRVSLPEGASFPMAEWLIIRRGVFSARDLAPRSLNDQWRHPSKPAGHEWASINLHYPDVPRVSGRYRLVRQEAPLLTREDMTVTHDPAQTRLVWSCKEGAALPSGAGLALLLDGEIWWYGRVGETRTGSLVAGQADPQSLTPIVFRNGPLPVQFIRRD